LLTFDAAAATGSVGMSGKSLMQRNLPNGKLKLVGFGISV